jgi:hypothetical protein
LFLSHEMGRENMSWITGAGLGRIYSTIQNYWNQPGAVNAPANKSEIYVEPTKIDSLLSREDLISYSFKAFERFKKVWDFDNFWKRANTCDACISLSEALIAQKPNDPEVGKILQAVQEMLEQNLAYYKTCEIDEKWGDDFGWCGLMGLNAYKLLKKLGNETLAIKYFDLSRDCWCYMIKHGYDESMDSKPVAQGCRNNPANSPNDGVAFAPFHPFVSIFRRGRSTFLGSETFSRYGLSSVVMVFEVVRM